VNTIGTVSSDAINALFSATGSQQDQLDSLSNSALSRGVDFYQNGNYDAAAKEFQRSIALSPTSSYVKDSYKYLVQSLLNLNRTDDAIKACKQAIQSDPTNDSYHSTLGDIYFSLDRYADAAAEYNQAVRLNPASAANWYSLGQAYNQTGNYAGAEQAFKRITGQEPLDAAFGLGQTYHLMGRYNDAVSELQSAIAINPKLGYAYLELGRVYTDQKEFGKAKGQASTLSSIDQSLASQLSSYIDQNESPQILAAYGTDFISTAGPGTKVSDLDPSLADPNSSKDFTMHFIFSKPMDASTVTSLAEWSITKAYGQTPGGDYNWGLPLAPTEVTVSSTPVSVVYDQNSQTADVKFRVTQNAWGDGTLDPSHLVFAFHGLDAYGKAMDAAADQYSGISNIV
jgi:tetratricopeptide (TPR) repeat protein